MPVSVDLGCGVVHALHDSLVLFVEVERFAALGHFDRCNAVGVWVGGCLYSTGCVRPRKMFEYEALDVCDVIGVA
jgi:hypothetical protein